MQQVKYVPLESVGVYFNPANKTLYPMAQRVVRNSPLNGTWCPDLDCGVHISDCEDELFERMSAKDLKSICTEEE